MWAGLFDLARSALLRAGTAVVMLRRAVDKTYIVRFSIGEALFLLLALWAAISTVWSSDRYAALIESSHLVAAAAIFWAMAQLVQLAAIAVRVGCLLSAACC